MDVATFLERLLDQGDIEAVMRNEFAQFGPEDQTYLGATLLPEETRTDNEYRETNISYMTMIATSGTRYSPAQLQDGGVVGGEMIVVLGDSDIAQQLKSQQYDALTDELMDDASMGAQQFLGWLDDMVNMALVQYNEVQRWNCIEDAQVIRVLEGTEQPVNYPDPTGHRVSASTDWTDDTKDPFESDILPIANMLREKGLTIENIVTSNAVMDTLRRNKNVAIRAGRINQTQAGDVLGMSLNEDDVANVFTQNRLPVPQTYDARYFEDSTTAKRFMSEDVMVFTCMTGDDREVRLSADPTQRRILSDTLGYTGVGTPAGQSDPGRTVDLAHRTNKPPRIEAEGWQTSLPVLTNPEAVGVINNITTP